MKPRILLLMAVIALALQGCKSYEVMHYKGAEIDKAGDVSKSKVYLHAKGHVFSVVNPTLTKTDLQGGLTPVTDPAEAAEIRDPSTSKSLMKKHVKDLNIFTKTEIADSAKNVTLKKTDISDYSRVVVHSHFGQSVRDGILDGLGAAVGIAAVGAIVYWFTLTPN